MVINRPFETEQGTSDRLWVGKTIVVTGGSKGIGRGIVLAAAAQGARIAFCARHTGQETCQLIDQAERLTGPGNVIGIQADVSREDAVQAFFDRTIAAFGRVDVVINNAGLYSVDPRAAPTGLILQVPTSEWDAVIATNLTGAFLVSRRAIQVFLSQGTGGSIITIGSVSQDGGTGLVSYAVSKAGLLGLTESIVKEYGPKGIRAHVMVVGFLHTSLNKDVPDKYLQMLIDWGPQKRAGRVEEVASVALFLASSHSALINGEPIFVSGGAKDVPAYLVKVG